MSKIETMARDQADMEFVYTARCGGAAGSRGCCLFTLSSVFSGVSVEPGVQRERGQTDDGSLEITPAEGRTPTIPATGVSFFILANS